MKLLMFFTAISLLLSTRLTMLCKDFNIKQLESGSWMSFDDLNNEETYNLEDLKTLMQLLELIFHQQQI